MAELIRTPDVVKSISSAIGRGLKQGASVVKNYAVSNVSGRILKRGSGELAKSIYAKVSRTRTGGNLRVGTKLHYGRFWEYGFKHRGRSPKKFRTTKPGRVIPARRWLRPAADQAMPEITKFIELEVDRELKAMVGKVTIEIKLT